MNAINSVYLKHGDSKTAPEMSNVGGNDMKYKPVGGSGLVMAHFRGGSSDGYIVVRKGNGYFAGDDLSLPIAANSDLLCLLEAGRYLQTTGENKGHIVLCGTPGVTACVIETE